MLTEQIGENAHSGQAAKLLDTVFQIYFYIASNCFYICSIVMIYILLITRHKPFNLQVHPSSFQTHRHLFSTSTMNRTKNNGFQLEHEKIQFKCQNKTLNV